MRRFCCVELKKGGLLRGKTTRYKSKCPPWESNPSCVSTPHRRQAEGENSVRVCNEYVKRYYSAGSLS